MQYILLLAILGGCATSMDTLIVEAKECVAQSSNDAGVIGASNEQSTACWIAVNEQLEVQARRQAKRDLEEAERCLNGYVKVCDWTGCGCITNRAFREWIKRSRF